MYIIYIGGPTEPTSCVSQVPGWFGVYLPTFARVWDANQLIEEIEANVGGARVVDIPAVNKGSNNYALSAHISMISRLKYIKPRETRRGQGFDIKAQSRDPAAAAAKQSLLLLIPRIIPEGGDQASLYRLVLEHGDFGIQNTTITTDVATGGPLVTSLFDWETGHIVPATLSDPMAVAVDLTTDDDAAPAITRVGDETAPSDQEEYVE
ncbi:hypothetical protein RB596_001677 [Gaeumannomyces avenae]